MFEKTLSDLVRGIRAHKGNEAQYISQCMTEIKRELKQENPSVKANAISKLTYLQMMGYDITWAAFNMIEVMSSTRFTFKRIGYLAASQCFHEGLDVVMLTTNMIRKDISSHNQYDASLSLTGLSCFMTPDLARDLANDVLTLMSSSKPYLRKKAVLVMYKVFLKFPDSLRPAFPRLKDRLEDPDPGVQSAAVSVICELARKNPRNYLSLAPVFFKLMTNSTNNWMLIKIIKLFGALTPLEPRLGKKLVDPLTSLIHGTTAMSLLYECISTVVSGMPNHTPSIQLCVSKLRLFVEDADQNLKYLGLLAMAKILQQQPKAMHQLKDLVVDCLDDRDESIRVRALELISGMVSKKNLTEIVKKLMVHADQSESTNYRDLVLSKILQICAHNNYQYITNFEWYITVLVEMTRFEGTRQGKLIASQMLDVAIRVKDVRPFAVKQMATILENTHLFAGSGRKEGICEVLYAAAWIVGEFSEHLVDPHTTLNTLLNPKITTLPGHIQAVFVQNIVKLYASILVKAEAEGTPEAVEEVGAMLVEKLPVFMQSGDLEVQERACCILQLMKYIVKLQGKGAAVADELVTLFEGDLNPVAPKAQKKVPVPEGLDLDKWINEPSSSEDEGKDEDMTDWLSGQMGSEVMGQYSPATPKRSKKEREEDEEEYERRREQRRQEQLTNPHYLKASPKTEKRIVAASEGRMDVSGIPVNKLELGVALVIDEPKPTKKGRKGKGKKKRRKRKGEESSDEEVVPRPAVDTSMGEMPEGAMPSDGEDQPDAAPLDDVSKALNQNLDVPLRDDEVLPVRTHRVVAAALKEDKTEEVKPKKEKSKRRKKGRKEEEGEEEGEVEEEGEGERKGKRGKGRKKRRSKKHGVMDEEEKTTAGGEASLIDISESQPPTEERPVAKEATTLDSVATSEVTKKKATRTATGDADLDDFEFWLSTTDAPAPGKAQTESTKEEAAAEPVTEEEGKRKKRREKKGKKEKRGGKKHKSKQPETEAAAEVANGGGLLDLVDVTTPSVKQASSFKILAEDESLSMTYETRANPLYSSQITVAVVFTSKSANQITALKFNVLDSLNAKLERPIGCSPHDSVTVPFQLPPGTANECQFTFYVASFQVPQKLRGTLTYMVKAEDITLGEKLDFTIVLPCSAFICPIPFAQQQFTSLLSSGSLCETQSVKLRLTNTASFAQALQAISSTLHVALVEQIEESASLYGYSISNHHVCLLVKGMGEGQLTVNAKGSDSQMISNLVEEIKAVV